MVTIFTIPKPFDGHIGMIQRNALRSWVRLEGVELLLIGDDAGVAEAARELGARHLGDVDTSMHGTPLVSSAFQRAASTSRHPLLAYANADIVLLRDFVDALRTIRFRQFLLVGQRRNLSLRMPIAFDDPAWQQKLRAAGAAAELAGEHWIDYFVLPRDSSLIDDLPPFVVGRPTWDNWLIHEARRRALPVIDATSSIMAVHQDHDYIHVPGGTGRGWEGPEAAINIELFGNRSLFGTGQATHVLTRRGPARPVTVRYIRSRWEARYDVDGRVERLGGWIDPALAPARWLYRKWRLHLPQVKKTLGGRPE